MTNLSKQLQTMTQAEVNEYIEQHHVWVMSEGMQGKRADFSNTRLKDILIRNTLGEDPLKLHKLRCKNAELVNVKFHHTELDFADFTGSQLNNIHILNSTMHRMKINNAHIANCQLKHVTGQYVQCKHTAISNSNMAETELDNLQVSHNEWHTCLLLNTHLNHSEINNTTFTNLYTPALRLKGATIEDTTFDDCLMPDTNFYHATFSNTKFWSSDLTAANFEDANVDMPTLLKQLHDEDIIHVDTSTQETLRLKQQAVKYSPYTDDRKLRPSNHILLTLLHQNPIFNDMRYGLGALTVTTQQEPETAGVVDDLYDMLHITYHNVQRQETFSLTYRQLHGQIRAAFADNTFSEYSITSDDRPHVAATIAKIMKSYINKNA